MPNEALLNTIDSLIQLLTILICGVLFLVFFYICVKFYTLNKYIDEKYKNNMPDTYRGIKKSFKEEISELDAKVLPNKQTITSIVDKYKELKK